MLLFGGSYARFCLKSNAIPAGVLIPIVSFFNGIPFLTGAKVGDLLQTVNIGKRARANVFDAARNDNAGNPTIVVKELVDQTDGALL